MKPNIILIMCCCLAACYRICDAADGAISFDPNDTVERQTPTFEENAQYWKNYREATSRAIRVIHKEIQAGMTDTERSTFEKTKINFGLYANINAFAAYRKNEITVFLGLVF